MNIPSLGDLLRARLESVVIGELSSLPLIRPLKKAEIAAVARHSVNALLKRTTLVQNRRVRKEAYEDTRELAEVMARQAAAMGQQCLAQGLMSIDEIEGTIDGEPAVQHTLFMVVLNPDGEQQS